MPLLVALGLLGLTALQFAASRLLLGRIFDPELMASWLNRAHAPVQGWTLGDAAPYRYRLLFRGIVLKTFEAVCSPDDSTCFLECFQAWSFLAFLAAQAALYALLRRLGFTRRLSFAGNVLFTLSPPVLGAYNVPVFTREDPLAYALVAATIVAVLDRRLFRAAVLATVGVLCRETTLIGLAPLAFARDLPLRDRFSPFFPPVLVLIAVRLWLHVPYASLGRSAVNVEYPLETAGFAFLTFGAVWIFALRALVRRLSMTEDSLGIIGASSLFAISAICLSAFFLGRIREIRLLFLSFPWVIPLALDEIRRRRFVGTAHLFLLGGLLLILIAGLRITPDELVSPHELQSLRIGLWWWLLLIHGTLALVVLAIFSRNRT